MKNRIDYINNNIRYYHADALGSIIALTDENGNVTARYNYSPFGVTEIVQDTDGSGAANPFRYTGREHDETGLYYYRARYYSPEMGRFLSEDPIRFAGGDVNFYRYVRNRPLNLVDPLGLKVLYNGHLVTNLNVRLALTALDSALPNSDISVSGGDRYIDESGNIRSTTNNEIIPHSAKYSTHLMGLAVDFWITNFNPTEAFLMQFFDWLKMDYEDGHIHGDLRNKGRTCTIGITP